MEIYRLKEFKTNQLRKLYLNGNITEEQFKTADEFFKDHSAYEKEIDWNKGLKITWDELEKVIKKERNSKSQVKNKIRKGLEGFEEGKDYLVIGEGEYNGEPWVAYQPLTWESSRMIASHYTEPSRNEKGKIAGAKWCTAYQKDSIYWSGHNETEAFIYICGETIPTKKVAISISKNGLADSGSKFTYFLDDLNFNIWDFNDYDDTIKEGELLEIIPNLHDLIIKAYDNWKNKHKKRVFSKLILNPQTNRYDYNGNLSSNILNIYFISKDKKGFTINFGEVIGSFNCSGLQLKSLKGVPQKVREAFDCSNNNLTSLDGAPQEVGLDFDCHNNQLTSLKGAPQIVGENFNCSHSHLTSLEGAPQIVGGNFNCSENQLTSLKGAPQTVGRSFDCSENHLTSLEGSPQEVGRYFDCSKNHLTSLEGAPQEVGKTFWCTDNYLTSLEGAPLEVVGNFDCRKNPNLYSLNGIGKVQGEIYKDF